MYLAGWGLLPAVLLGILSSGTTTLAAYTLLTKLDLSDRALQILNMESVLNDSFIITCAIIVLQLIGVGTFDPQQLVGALALPLLTSIGLGVLFAVLWVQALWTIENVERWSYIFTLGLLFILYAIAEAFNGNGGIAVLVAGLTLVTLPATVQRFSTYPRGITVQYGTLRFNPTRLRGLQDRFDAVMDKVRNAQVNFAFIAENFFFVYFGILFDPTRLTTTLLGLSGVLVLLIFVSRYLSARFVGLLDQEVRREAVTLSIVVARSSTAIVVALLPGTMGIAIPQLKEMVLLMVLLSSLVTLIGLRLQERIGRGPTMVLHN
jgi:NhaP-type Na+/H+ or K+/H+ antiporter